MKRFFLYTFIFTAGLIVLNSCSPKTTTATSTLKRGQVSGDWVLSTITFDRIPESAVRSFLGEASTQCFVGSTWNLTNSGNGSYTLPTSASCAAKTQPIFWSVSVEDETFQFKKLNEGEKAKNVTDGYRLVLAATSSDQLVVKSPIEYGNGVAYVVLNFTRANR